MFQSHLKWEKWEVEGRRNLGERRWGRKMGGISCGTNRKSEAILFQHMCFVFCGLLYYFIYFVSQVMQIRTQLACTDLATTCSVRRECRCLREVTKIKGSQEISVGIVYLEWRLENVCKGFYVFRLWERKCAMSYDPCPFVLFNDPWAKRLQGLKTVLEGASWKLPVLRSRHRQYVTNVYEA